MIRLWLAQLPLFALLWLLFAASVEPVEVAAAILFGGGAATLSTVVWTAGLIAFRLPRGWAGMLVRSLAGVPAGALGVLRAVYGRRPVPSITREVPFEAVGDDPADVGRRAAAEALGSLAPETLVAGIDRKKKLLYFHRLREGDAPEAVRRLGRR